MYQATQFPSSPSDPTIKDDSEESFPNLPSATNNPIKRLKTFRACTLCRHHKTRCELGDEFTDGNNACRRCRHFAKRCSLQDNPATTPTKQSLVSRPSPQPLKDDPLVIVHKPYTKLIDEQHPDSIIFPDNDYASVKRSFMQYIIRSPFQDPLYQNNARKALSPLVRTRNEISGMLEWGRAIEAIRAIAGRTSRKTFRSKFPSPSIEPQALDIIFQAFYAPWVYWCISARSPSTTTPGSTFLKAVQHTLATKYPSTTSQLAIRPDVRLDIQAGVYRAMIGSTTDVDDLRALHILSLYTSTSTLSLSAISHTEPAGGQDSGELMMATSLRLACTMHLERAMQVVIDFRRATPSSSLHISAPLGVIESVDKCRLLYSLYITDCFIHIVKGRKPDVARVDVLRQAHLVFGSPHALLSTSQGIADARLVFLSSLCDITSCAFDVPVPDNVGDFPAIMRDIISELETWRMDFVPFAALSDGRSIYENQHILLQYHYCKLAVMIRVMLAIFRKGPKHQNEETTPGPERPASITPLVSIARNWVFEAMGTANSLVVIALSLTPFDQPSSQIYPSHPLASAPDYILSMIAFCALVLVKAQLHGNRTPERTPDLQAPFRAAERKRQMLLERLMQLFREVASEGRDLAGRYAAALEIFLGVLDEDRPSGLDSGAEFEGTFVPEDTTSGSAPPSNNFGSGSYHNTSHDLPYTTPYNNHESPMLSPSGDLNYAPFSSPPATLFPHGASMGWGDGGSGNLLDMSLFDLYFTVDSMPTDF